MKEKSPSRALPKENCSRMERSGLSDNVLMSQRIIARFNGDEMKRVNTNINSIPAIIWGDDSDKVFIHVHGKMSRKEYAEHFAGIAEKKGWQTISFDLPEHGERTNQAYRCDIWNGMKDLSVIADHAFSNWNKVSLFACSLGAYFALNTYADRKFDQILFQSPIVDMKWLVEHMMIWSNVTEEQLKQEQEIETPIDTLRWDYYRYIVEHPVRKWHKDTQILYGALDTLQEMKCLRDFAEKFEAKLTISEKSGHAFMGENDPIILNEWLKKTIRP